MHFLPYITAWLACRADIYGQIFLVDSLVASSRAPGASKYVLSFLEQPGIAQLATGEEITHLSCTSSLPTMGVIVNVPLIPK